MNAKNIADDLLKQPTARVLIKVDGEWIEVTEVKVSHQFNNCLTIHAEKAIEPQEVKKNPVFGV